MGGASQPAPTLRKLGVSEAGALATLCAATFKQAYADVHSAANLEAYCAANYTPDKMLALLFSVETHCKIASRGDLDVGYCLLVRHDGPIPLDGASVELKQIYVLASEYGGGLARLLFDDARETTRKLGAKRIWLAVADSNTRAQAFYQKLDFEKVGVGPTFDVGTDRLTSSLLARVA